MKKRLPSIVVIGATLLAVLMIYLWPYIFPPKAEIDSDKDGFIDRIDRCDDQFSKTNLGCPEKPTINEKDRDGDGYLLGFQKDASLQDEDDADPCNPNPTCSFCDTDGDGLTYPQELAKSTKPDIADTDGDGVNDAQDVCPLEYGVNLSKGCPINISVNLRKNGQKLVWNSELNEQELETYLYITCLENESTIPPINVTNKSNYVLPKYRKNDEYKAELKIKLKQPKAVKTSNTTTRW